MDTQDPLFEAITKKMADIDWMNPLWLDEIKEEFRDVPESKIDEIYLSKLTEKVDSMSKKALQNILKEESTMDPASRNFLLQKIIGEKISKKKK
jgi:hypothetical protein